MGMSFVRLLLARVKSKSPKFYVTLRWVAGILAFVMGLVLMVFKVNAFHVSAAVDAEVMSWCEQIGSGLSGVFLFTWTGTADPALLEKPVEETSPQPSPKEEGGGAQAGVTQQMTKGKSII